MLAQAEMLVVFVLSEVISYGSSNTYGGKKRLRLVSANYDPLSPKVPQKRFCQKWSDWNAVNPSSEQPKHW